MPTSLQPELIEEMANTTLQFHADARVLTDALVTVEPAVAKKSDFASLRSVLLVQRDNTLTLTTSNLELSVQTKLVTTQARNGVCAVTFADLKRIVENLTGDLAFAVEDKSLIITHAQGSYQLGLQDATDILPFGEIGTPETMDKQKFIDIVHPILSARSVDASRPVLTGVQMTFDGKKMTCVATDSYRLAWHEKDAGESIPKLNLIVPGAALEKINAQLRNNPADEISLAHNQTHMSIQAGNTVYNVRTIDGSFPNHNQLIPNDFAAEADVDRAAFLAALTRVCGVLRTWQDNDQGTLPPLALTFETGKLRLRANANNGLIIEENMDLDYRWINSREAMKPITIGFNPEFILQGAQQFASDKVTFSVTGPLRPGLLGAPASALKCLVMPVRLEEQTTSS